VFDSEAKEATESFFEISEGGRVRKVILPAGRLYSPSTVVNIFRAARFMTRRHAETWDYLTHFDGC
jgi:hypothetical protein